ncbi:hypothetical protein, partial [Halorubrum tebenquichense]|uniref:hypothetical protein n=1 Tax=Halorubrum tebenquichense TaxID=119434 RepID=UPI0019D3F027
DVYKRQDQRRGRRRLPRKKACRWSGRRGVGPRRVGIGVEDFEPQRFAVHCVVSRELLVGVDTLEAPAPRYDAVAIGDTTAEAPAARL